MGKLMFSESRRSRPPADFAAQASAQPDIYNKVLESFWEREARERLTRCEPVSTLYPAIV